MLRCTIMVQRHNKKRERVRELELNGGYYEAIA